MNVKNHGLVPTETLCNYIFFNENNLYETEFFTRCLRFRRRKFYCHTYAPGPALELLTGIAVFLYGPEYIRNYLSFNLLIDIGHFSVIQIQKNIFS